MIEKSRLLLLFDVDGTLTLPMRTITEDLLNFLTDKVSPKATVGLVGGSDYAKISKQMGGEQGLLHYDHVFCENGLVHYSQGKKISAQSMLEFVGESKMQKFINFCLRYMSELTLPAKRGNFVEFRTGMLNVSPIGRSCSQAERDEFVKYDKENNIRADFIAAMRREFPDAGLQFSNGGQISVDVFPIGWDKTYCLRHLDVAKFQEIHFFGDKTDPGGNDHELYEHPKTIGHKVAGPDDTMRQLMELLKIKE